jgi:uncharacterized membrane protein
MTKARLVHSLTVFFLLLGGILGSTGSAHAWLKICNKTTKSVYYEHSLPDSSCYSGYREKGWWNIAPNQCSTVYGGAMENKFVVYYAEATDGSITWSGTRLYRAVPFAAFDRCGGLYCYACRTTQPPAGTAWRVHRDLTATSTNYTINLTP